MRNLQSGPEVEEVPAIDSNCEKGGKGLCDI